MKAKLPKPDQENRKATVIYDGSCRFCAGNLPWLYRLDWRGRFDSLPYRSEKVYDRFPSLSREKCERAIHVVFPDGKIYAGADALREIFLQLPLLAIAGAVMAIPPLPWISRNLYRLLAPYRHRLGRYGL
jgi:predicted DCC family thiol-disulfide oxidoreductase YuxK